jgi:hypothetical protein
MKSFFDNQSLFTVIWKWKQHLIIVGVITIIASAVFSSPYFITPLFQSQARVYPTNTQSYSEESESEQMLEVFNSTDIKRQIVDAFELTSRYGIKEDDPYFRTKILKKYDDRIECKKTEYESIELMARDADPQIASNIVDSLVAFYNRKILFLRQQKAFEEAFSYQNDLVRKKKEIDRVSSEMESLRKEYGLLDYEIQTEQVTMGYMTALAEGANRTAVNDIKDLMTNLEKKGGQFFLLQRELEALEIQRDTINRRYDKAIAIAEKEETYTMVVEEPFPADKKSYPTRWLIVLVSLIAVEFLALLTVFSLEGIKSSKQ